MKKTWRDNKQLIQIASKFIAGFEGFSSTPYLCSAGVYTIGFGTTQGVTKDSKPINRHQAQKLLEQDIEGCIKVIERFVEVELNINQMAALCSFIYNIGEGNFKKSSALTYINEGNFEKAMERLLLWNKARNKDNELVVLNGLVRRRQAEKELFLTEVE